MTGMLIDLGALAEHCRTTLAGKQQVGFVGWTHPTRRDPQYLASARMDFAEALPPGQSLTGALKVVNQLLTEEQHVREKWCGQVPSPFYYEGIYVSWVLRGKPITNGVAGEVQDMPVIIHSKDGEPYFMGQRTMGIPPFLMAELKRYDRILKEIFTSE